MEGQAEGKESDGVLEYPLDQHHHRLSGRNEVAVGLLENPNPLGQALYQPECWILNVLWVITLLNFTLFGLHVL